MANSGTKKAVGGSIKEHCIDLPGESIQCWVGKENSKLKVILRKHRDVIFDFHVGHGSTYTLESTESDFYNVRDKKLVRAGQVGKVTFRDGEKMHVWVAREFRGALIVKSKGQIKSQIIPNQLDSYQYSDQPEEKPAPIIISVDHNTEAASRSQGVEKPIAYPQSLIHEPNIPRAASVSLPEFDYPVVCVVDGTTVGMPADLVEYFQNGGGQSGFADIDPMHITTRNWILGQIAGAGAYIKDNWDWLRASIDGNTVKGLRLVKAKVHYVRGKIRFYFSGYSNTNTVFGRGGFGAGSDRIMTIFAGAGKTESSFAAAMKGVAGTFKGNALFSFIFGSATAMIEWKADSKKDGYDLAASLITSAIKAVLVAALVSVAVAAAVFLGAVWLGAAVTVVTIGAVTVVASVIFSYAVDAGDKAAGRALTKNASEEDGVSSILAPALRHAGRLVEKNWEYLASKMSGDYQEIRFDNAI